MKRDLILLGAGILLVTLGYVFHGWSLNLIGGFSIGYGGVDLIIGEDED